MVFGTLDMIPGIIALRNAYRLSLTGMQFTDETIEALEQMARTGDNAAAYMLKQLADNGNVAAIKAYDVLMKEAVDSVTGWSDAGLTPSKIREILDTPKGSRPDPATYLTKEYIDAHLAKFDDGAVKFAWGINPKYNGTVGSPGGQFVMPKSVADDLIKKANGDISMLEKLLGLNPGDLGTSPIRIDIDASNLKGLRMPSGNEVGANKLWMPGGYTDGLLPEAVIDPLNIGEYTYSPIF